ncbi:MAG: hydrogen peroxide-dependent heme synthase [Pirellulaceae bacterium]
MNRPAHGQPPAEPSLEPDEGWHCSHLYYRFDRGVLAALAPTQVQDGREALLAALAPEAADAPQRLQTSLVSGNKADFSLMLMDANPLTVEAVNQKLLTGKLGPALIPTYSFVSMTEVSEYVPSVHEYAKRIIQDGEPPGSAAYSAKVKAYEARLPAMNKQRLTPEFPAGYPATCFYPMSKKRKVGENWFSLAFSARNRMMAEHARSGMEFAGKVSQLITVGVGFDDWEWGVTLWARNPQFLKDIVYRMRFDEASARYGEFGSFYTSYVMSPSEMLDRCLGSLS